LELNPFALGYVRLTRLRYALPASSDTRQISARFFQTKTAKQNASASVDANQQHGVDAGKRRTQAHKEYPARKLPRLCLLSLTHLRVRLVVSPASTRAAGFRIHTG